MSNGLVMTHHVNLTREQRYSTEEFEAVGVSSPLWTKDGHWIEMEVEEVFCKYRFRQSDEEKDVVKMMDGGHLITLNSGMKERLRDIRDGGIECLLFTHRTGLAFGEQMKPVVHCVQIGTDKELQDSLA